MAVLHPHRSQHVFSLQGVERQRVRFQREQVDHRHTVQAQMLFGKAEIMFPAFCQHHVDFKPGEFSRKDYGLQPTQAGKHEFLTEGEVLQQQLIAAKTTAPLRPKVVIIVKSQHGEIAVKRSSVYITRHPQPQARRVHGKGFMHGAG